MTSRPLVSLLVAAVLVLGSAAEAAADNKVVVMKFRGPRSGKLRKQVLRVIRPKADLEGQARFVREQRKLRARKINNRDIAKVCQSLGIHGVVLGRVRRRRGRYKLNVQLRAGVDGAVVEDVTVNLGRRPRLSKRARRTIRRRIANSIADLPEPVAFEEEEVEDVPDERWEEEDIGGGDDDVDAEIEEEGDEADGDDEEEVSSLSNEQLHDVLGRERAIDLAAGLSVVARTLSFDVAPSIMDRPNGYNGTPVPGAYVQGELYPLAMDHKKKNKSALAGLGASFVVDKVLQITSKLEGGAVDIDTEQLRWGVGVRYRVNFGDKPTGPTVKLGVGYNKLEFALDQQQIADNMLDIDLPNVAYTYIDPGLFGRLPFTREWAGYADVRFMLISDTGDMQLSENYGAASVNGVDIDAGVEHRLSARLLVRGGLRFQRIAFTFDGNGDLTDRDGDGMSDVPSATDQYLGGYLTAGYLF